METVKCPDCFKVVSTRFSLHECRIVTRYYVSPASTRRGWLVKRVVRVDGKETGDNWSLRHQTKREAKACKDDLNRRLGEAFEAIGSEKG